MSNIEDSTPAPTIATENNVEIKVDGAIHSMDEQIVSEVKTDNHLCVIDKVSEYLMGNARGKQQELQIDADVALYVIKKSVNFVAQENGSAAHDHYFRANSLNHKLSCEAESQMFSVDGPETKLALQSAPAPLLTGFFLTTTPADPADHSFKHYCLWDESKRLVEECQAAVDEIASELSVPSLQINDHLQPGTTKILTVSKAGLGFIEGDHASAQQVVCKGLTVTDSEAVMIADKLAHLTADLLSLGSTMNGDFVKYLNETLYRDCSVSMNQIIMKQIPDNIQCQESSDVNKTGRKKRELNFLALKEESGLTNEAIQVINQNFEALKTGVENVVKKLALSKIGLSILHKDEALTNAEVQKLQHNVAGINFVEKRKAIVDRALSL